MNPKGTTMDESSQAKSPLAHFAAAVGSTASAVGEAAGGAISVAGKAINAAVDTMGSIAKNIEEDKVARHAPKVAEGLDGLEGMYAENFLGTLGQSPLALTESLDAKVKATFPIPREQTVLWVDAEFDLRPSGIVVTDAGVFIKSDAAVINPRRKGSARKESRLSYFPWESFDSAWFANEDESNPALTVCTACAERFVAACKTTVRTQTKIAESQASTTMHNLAEPDAPLKAAAIEGAAALSAERAVFTEQKATVNTPAGHGEMAEEAITVLDRLHGIDAKVVGRDNAKDGADRLVENANGEKVFIQTKFYNSARGSLEACFDPTSGQYRYVAGDGSPMQLEVPKDQYERVLAGFKRKIEQGKVPGVTDPEDAALIVRKGRLTYKQAVNLTKPGTIESLVYDAATGAVACSCAFGISFVATAFTTYQKTGDREAAVQAGIAAGIQVFGMSFTQHVIVSQLSRTGALNALITPSQMVVEKLGYKAAQTIVNGLRALSGKSAISGAAATKQLAKILRSNALTAVVTFAVFSVPETYKLVSRKASAAQYTKNIASLAGSIVGGIGGAVAAGAAAAKAGALAGTTVAPGIGTVVGVAGGFVGGVAGSAAVGAVGGVLYEGDGATFSRYFNAMVSCMAVEYLLDKEELEELIGKLDKTNPSDFKKLMESFFSSNEQETVIRMFLTPLLDEIVEQREPFALPSNDEIVSALVDLGETQDVDA